MLNSAEQKKKSFLTSERGWHCNHPVGDEEAGCFAFHWLHNMCVFRRSLFSLRRGVIGRLFYDCRPFLGIFFYFFSSPEYKMLKMSYCDRFMSATHCLSVRRQQFLHMTST